jgi:hypothetical protein
MDPKTLAAIRSFAERNKDNEAVAGAVNDLFINSLSARLQTDSDASYAKTMMPLSLEYQRGAQGIATEADMRRISAEGSVLRDLTSQQGKIQKDVARINSGDVRYVANKQLAGNRIEAGAQVRSTQIGADATKDVAKTNLQGTRYTADAGVKSTQISSDAQVRSTQIGADAQRYGADREVDSTRISADAQVRSTQIGADAQRYGYDSAERQRRIEGEENRKTLTQGTDETLRLRADARGQIASTGKRFFG